MIPASISDSSRSGVSPPSHSQSSARSTVVRSSIAVAVIAAACAPSASRARTAKGLAQSQGLSSHTSPPAGVGARPVIRPAQARAAVLARLWAGVRRSPAVQLPAWGPLPKRFFHAETLRVGPAEARHFNRHKDFLFRRSLDFVLEKFARWGRPRSRGFAPHSIGILRPLTILKRSTRPPP